METLASLKILFWNARELNSKLTEFKTHLYLNDIDVACVCETFLKSTKPTQINGCKTIQVNRTKCRFGGLILFIRDVLVFEPVRISDMELLECSGVKLGKVHIILVYLPGQSNDAVINRHLINDITKLNSSFTNKFIVGDFNARHRTWNCADNNRAGNLLNQFLNNSMRPIDKRLSLRPLAVRLNVSMKIPTKP